MRRREDASSTRERVNRPAKKSFGQHFLRDEKLIAQLLATCPLSKDLGVVEIGPGQGAMTRGLAKAARWVLAVEADRDLAADLQRTYPAGSSVHVLQADALTVDFDCEVKTEPFAVVANLPYNMGTPILFHLLRFHRRIPWMAIMLQKEVVERLAAAPGSRDYGRLSVLPQIYYRVLPQLHIPGNRFVPKTKVDSSFVRLERREVPLVDLSDAEFGPFFEKFLAELFRFRRKTLKNVLAAMSFLQGQNVAALLESLSIDASWRTERLDIATIEALARAVYGISTR